MSSADHEQIFGESEGDRWFKRSRLSLGQFDAGKDWPLKLIELYNLRPRKVLEVGGANGSRLAAIHTSYNPDKLVVVEPSKEAIKEGQGRYPFIHFVRGLAFAMPLEETFDLIIVNFVFHWIGRDKLLRSVAEIDRLLEDKGFLIIGDFFPSNQLKVPYHHLPNHGVYTYKQNYAAPFLASGLYRLVCALTGGHSSKELAVSVPEMERSGVFLLEKTLGDSYIETVVAPEESQ